MLKNILPKRLFYRGLLIVAAPVIIMQLTISIVFFDSLWIKTNNGMTKALVGEVNTFLKAYQEEAYDRESLIDVFQKYLDFSISYEDQKILPNAVPEKWYSPIDRSLRRELKAKKLNYWFDTRSFKNLIDLKIKFSDGYFQFYIPKDRLTSSSARLFALWITLPAIFVIAIAIIFLKNQTRPIVKLAKASERFGKGENIDYFRPSGALEIRMAGDEFNKMQKRIQRHLNQRSEMLSGISHDLRTPLTRIKLQISLIKDEKISEKMSQDVTEMEKMLNEYLQFASSNSIESTETFNFSELVKKIIIKYENTNISSDVENNIYYDGRKNLIQRCLNNIIDNSIKFGKLISISLKKKNNNILITIDDNGPGIPKEELENVFKPFYKIDKGRDISKSSVGLGLSIAMDIIKSHGGRINLKKSPDGGLRVEINLPF
tara:strand:+ start:117 stop:1409 length:1293 start_codon:yes stop_codon:yes gene_type:complete